MIVDPADAKRRTENQPYEGAQEGEAQQWSSNSSDPRCRFKFDHSYLLRSTCHELLKYDKYKRGLVPAGAFNNALDDLRLKFGTAELDLIMHYCRVSDDGYVNYKDLLIAAHPSKGIYADDCVADVLQPRNICKQDALECRSASTGHADCCSSSGFSPDKSGEVRRAYAQWDKGALRDHEFVEHLKRMNINITPEFERLLAKFGPSRTLPFSRFMQALRINDSDWYTETQKQHPDIHNCVALPVIDRRAIYDAKRNPITWEKPRYTGQEQSRKWSG